MSIPEHLHDQPPDVDSEPINEPTLSILRLNSNMEVEFQKAKALRTISSPDKPQ